MISKIFNDSTWVFYHRMLMIWTIFFSSRIRMGRRGIIQNRNQAIGTFSTLYLSTRMYVSFIISRWEKEMKNYPRREQMNWKKKFCVCNCDVSRETMRASRFKFYIFLKRDTERSLEFEFVILMNCCTNFPKSFNWFFFRLVRPQTVYRWCSVLLLLAWTLSALGLMMFNSENVLEGFLAKGFGLSV